MGPALRLGDPSDAGFDQLTALGNGVAMRQALVALVTVFAETSKGPYVTCRSAR
jgi:hypothetical protein